MKRVGRILGGVQMATVALGVVFLVVMTSLMFVTTVLRYFIGSAVPYTMVILTGLMVWITFLLIGSVARNNEHLRITLLPDIVFRERSNEFVAAIENLVATPLCLYMTWVGIDWLDFRIDQGARYMIGYTDSYPAWIPNMILPIGFGLASLFYLERSIKQISSFIQQRRNGQNASDAESDNVEMIQD